MQCSAWCRAGCSAWCSAWCGRRGAAELLGGAAAAAHDDELPSAHSHGTEAKDGLMLARICFATSHCTLACSAEMVPEPSKAPSAIMDEL